MSDTTSVYQAYQGNTYLFGGNAPYVEEMYENYLANPGSVPDNCAFSKLRIFRLARPLRVAGIVPVN